MLLSLSKLRTNESLSLALSLSTQRCEKPALQPALEKMRPPSLANPGTVQTQTALNIQHFSTTDYAVSTDRDLISKAMSIFKQAMFSLIRVSL